MGIVFRKKQGLLRFRVRKAEGKAFRNEKAVRHLAAILQAPFPGWNVFYLHKSIYRKNRRLHTRRTQQRTGKFFVLRSFDDHA